MSSTLVTQSRSASLMASLRVALPCSTGDDLGAEHPHPGDVERLALGVDLAHVDAALEPEQRRGGGRGDAVLAGAGLGDDPGLAHPLGEQGLGEHVVDLVRAGVVEVLALEDDPGAAAVLGEPRHLGDDARAGRCRCGAAASSSPTNSGSTIGLAARLVELLERGDQRLGDVAAAERRRSDRDAGSAGSGVRSVTRSSGCGGAHRRDEVVRRAGAGSPPAHQGLADEDRVGARRGVGGGVARAGARRTRRR